MVFVQSFWSKPFLNTDSNEFNYRVSGGFTDKKYFYYSWALSFLSLKNFGRKCLLVTDDLGKYLLIEALGMEYDEVRLELNELKNLSSSYWAIPKLHVYQTMDEPFLHFDGDLILYPAFKDLGLENHDLVFEFKNDIFSDDHLKSINYMDGLLFDEIYQPEVTIDESDICEPFAIRSSLFNTCKKHTGELNCGVIGGRDYKFLNEFAS